jgi:reactive intermediate/imine deaminase
MIERTLSSRRSRPARPLFPGRSRRRFHLRLRPGPHRPGHQPDRPGDVKAETRQVLSNIQRILEGCGATMADVVKCGVFLTDVKDFAAMNEVYAEFFGNAKPARTTIAVAALPLPGAKVEIDAVAYKPLARLAGRRRPPDPVALRRPLRFADAGAVGARRGARPGGPPGGGRRPQHPRVDRRKGGAAPGLRRIRHHRRLHGSGEGGFIEGPKNLALALVAFELAWVDAGAATGSLAGCLALSPIHERGTAGTARLLHEPLRSAAARRRPQALARRVLPHRTDPLRRRRDRHAGRQSRVAEWKDGEEPMLQVEKRGRFITNMGFANFVTAAVDSDDPRIKGTCMVILEETDPGTLRPRHAHAQAGAPAFLHLRPDLQPEGAGQPHHRRLHREGRRDRAALQPRRDHRSGLPAHARDGGDHDFGQAALGASSR